MAIRHTLADPPPADVPLGYPTAEQARGVSPVTALCCPQDHVERVLLGHLRELGAAGPVRLRADGPATRTPTACAPRCPTAPSCGHASSLAPTAPAARSARMLGIGDRGAGHARGLPQRAVPRGPRRGRRPEVPRWTHRASPDRGPDGTPGRDGGAAAGRFRALDVRAAAPAGGGERLDDAAARRRHPRRGRGARPRPRRRRRLPVHDDRSALATTFRAGSGFLVGDAAHRHDADGRHRHEHRRARRPQPRLAARLGRPRPGRRRAAGRLRGGAAAVGRENVLRSLGRGGPPGSTGSLDTRPRRRPGTRGASRRRYRAPGRRTSRCSTTGGRISTLDLFDGRLTLLTGRRAEGWRGAAGVLAAYGLPVAALAAEPDLVDDGRLTRRYGLGDAAAVLVRPDGHCGPALPAVDAGHLTALTDAVDALLGTTRSRYRHSTMRRNL